MPRVLTISKSPEEALRELLKSLLEKGKVKAVLALREMGENGAVAYSLITDPGDVASTRPLFPSMPVNLGKQLSRLTLKQAATEPIAVVLRPCELRAFVELVKREQGSLENILVISSTCGGVYPLEMAVDGSIEDKLPEYWESVKKGEAVAGVRSACKACEYFVPFTADMTVLLLGNKDIGEKTALSISTDKGLAFVEGVDGKLADEELDTSATERIRSERQAEKQKLADEAELKSLGIDELTKTFSRCIGCRNCSKACPVCYCHVCFFEGESSEHDPTYFGRELDKAGAVEVLPDSLFFQLVRLLHVSASCVACGHCADVCPANIPLWAVSLRVSDAVQKAYDYVAGKDLEQPVPVHGFEPADFADV